MGGNRPGCSVAMKVRALVHWQGMQRCPHARGAPEAHCCVFRVCSCVHILARPPAEWIRWRQPTDEVKERCNPHVHPSWSCWKRSGVYFCVGSQAGPGWHGVLQLKEASFTEDMDIVEDVSVSLEKKCATVRVVAPVSEALPVLVAAIQDLGFEAKPAQ
eukprot:354227-Chlamydomonas_euryale.AAC.1